MTSKSDGKSRISDKSNKCQGAFTDHEHIYEMQLPQPFEDFKVFKLTVFMDDLSLNAIFKILKVSYSPSLQQSFRALKSPTADPR